LSTKNLKTLDKVGCCDGVPCAAAAKAPPLAAG
jgi:hypothetical protein